MSLTIGKFTAADLSAMTPTKPQDHPTCLRTILPSLDSLTKFPAALQIWKPLPTSTQTVRTIKEDFKIVLEEILTFRYQARMNLAAGTPMFMNNVRRSEEYIRLMELVRDDTTLIFNIKDAILYLRKILFDQTYQHPNDMPIAILCLALLDTGVDASMISPIIGLESLGNAHWTHSVIFAHWLSATPAR